MDFAELISARRSVRSYAVESVAEELLEHCLEAARRAPSACNAQPWHFVVVTDPEDRARLGELSRLPGTGMNRFMPEAPVIIALVTEKPNITSRIGAYLKDKPYYLMDVGIAAEHLCLQAAELGLGTCMIGWFEESAARELLQIPRQLRIALLITLGYPGDQNLTADRVEPGASDRSRPRKQLSEIASRGRYGRQW